MDVNYSGLKRPVLEMPDFIRDALDERALMEDYKRRPTYQQNDYIAWILRAKRPQTREKRLRQMLDELETGGVYMKMPHPSSKK